jgi:hypothetical protein
MLEKQKTEKDHAFRIFKEKHDEELRREVERYEF